MWKEAFFVLQLNASFLQKYLIGDVDIPSSVLLEKGKLWWYICVFWSDTGFLAFQLERFTIVWLEKICLVIFCKDCLKFLKWLYLSICNKLDNHAIVCYKYMKKTAAEYPTENTCGCLDWEQYNILKFSVLKCLTHCHCEEFFPYT